MHSFRIFLLILAGLFQGLLLHAQYTLRISVSVKPVMGEADSLFIAGSFNRWNPHQEGYALVKKGDQWEIELAGLQKNDCKFKFTRGSWEKAETDSLGNDIADRLISLNADSSVQFSIEGWKDQLKPVLRQHTASPQVHILDTAFFIPQLNRKRRITVYLPDGYLHGKQRYPVLYMNDGQNLFDEYMALYGEWGVDECIDSVTKNKTRPAIVVGIDNSPYRMTEYNPYLFRDYGEPEGDAYVDFIARTLKPFIDKKYRTLHDRGHTSIAGSSLGGLIAYYALLKYPDVFGNAGIFSPSFWVAMPPLKSLTSDAAGKVNGKVFFYMGEAEGESYVNDLCEMTDLLGEYSGAIVYRVIDPAGKHEEKSWRKWFAEFYTWVMGDGFNNQVRIIE